MSVIAVKIDDKITLGADSIIVRGYTQDKNTRAKIFKVDDSFAIAGCGMLRECSLLFLFSQTHRPSNANIESLISFFDEFYDWMKKKTDRQPADNNVFIIVFNGHVFSFEDFAISEVLEYYASGAGRDYAITTLYLGGSVEKAIGAACDLSIYCERPINIMTFEKAK